MKTITGNNGYSHLGIVFEEHEGLIEYFFPVYISHQAKFYLLINSTVSFFVICNRLAMRSMRSEPISVDDKNSLKIYWEC